MCPERQIISLYLDGELPSPWNEKMEAHLESCPKCRATLARYRGVGECLRAAPAKPPESDSFESAMERAQDRVWDKLTAPAISGETIKPKIYRSGVWNRTITLPLPAAAAAAVLIIAAFFALVGLRGGAASPSTSLDTVAALNIGFDDQGMVPVTDMSGVLHYLSSQDSGGDFMVIRLPESRNFSRNGEPTLINAADYSRRKEFR